MSISLHANIVHDNLSNGHMIELTHKHVGCGTVSTEQYHMHLSHYMQSQVTQSHTIYDNACAIYRTGEVTRCEAANHDAVCFLLLHWSFCFPTTSLDFCHE